MGSGVRQYCMAVRVSGEWGKTVLGGKKVVEGSTNEIISLRMIFGSKSRMNSNLIGCCVV